MDDARPQPWPVRWAGTVTVAFVLSPVLLTVLMYRFDSSPLMHPYRVLAIVVGPATIIVAALALAFVVGGWLLLIPRWLEAGWRVLGGGVVSTVLLLLLFMAWLSAYAS